MSAKSKINSVEVRSFAVLFILAGGMFGVLPTIVSLFNSEGIIQSVIMVLAVVLFSLTAWAGILLLQGDEQGFEIGKAVLILQVIQFSIGGLSYSFVAGAYFFIGIENLALRFNPGLGSNLTMLIGEATGFVIQVNAVAVAALVYLHRMGKRVTRNVSPDMVLDQSDELVGRRSDED